MNKNQSNKSLKGCCLVFWSWQRYIGYSRRFEEVRMADDDDTEELLSEIDKTNAIQCSILLTAEEVQQAPYLPTAICKELHKDSWKWTNEKEMNVYLDELMSI